jgi:F-type H+-transporting ATPase subunit epsilon
MALNVDIVTPEKIVYSGPADGVSAPGVLGEFDVLPEHALFLSLLRAGTVTVRSKGAAKRFVVGRGFAEAGPQRVVVLVDSCEAADSVDKAAAQALLQRAEAVILDSAPDTEERLAAERDVELARARLEA